MKKQLFFYAAALLIGCNQSRQAAPTAISAVEHDTVLETSATAPDRFQKQFESGIDFLASGNEPFWALEINFDSSMSFKTPEAVLFTAPVPEPSRAMDANVLRYAAASADGNLIVQIQQQPCENDMSGEKMEYRVSVDLKTGNAPQVHYQGCGRYLNDYRINDIWVLESINGKGFDATGFSKGAPRLEFSLREKRVIGQAGCNEFSGAAEIQGKKIKFGMFRSTKMACEQLTFERNFMNLVNNQTVGYSIAPGKLTLQLNKDSVFVYKKVD